MEILASYPFDTFKASMDVFLTVDIGQISGGLHETFWIVIHRWSAHLI